MLVGGPLVPPQACEAVPVHDLRRCCAKRSLWFDIVATALAASSRGVPGVPRRHDTGAGRAVPPLPARDLQAEEARLDVPS